MSDAAGYRSDKVRSQNCPLDLKVIDGPSETGSAMTDQVRGMGS